jgi:hypothetical protein
MLKLFLAKYFNKIRQALTTNMHGCPRNTSPRGNIVIIGVLG